MEVGTVFFMNEVNGNVAKLKYFMYSQDIGKHCYKQETSLNCLLFVRPIIKEEGEKADAFCNS